MRLWHVVLTVAGPAEDLAGIDAALRRFINERPFIRSLRYDEWRAEVSYWEEADDMLDAASLALRLWNEHRDSAKLPDWPVVGLEVVERDTFQARNVPVPVAPTETVPRRFS
ncbi:MAG: hypothetical protein ACRDPG_06015 [Nocardioidaceae bacterium]